MKPLITVLLGLWLACVLVLGATRMFVTPPGAAPLPIGLGVVVPLLVFLAAFWGAGSLRTLVLTANLPLLTAVQAWRFAGFGFIALYVYGVLPGAFAWPAGLGDMAIGMTAPWVALALVRRPGLAASRWFVVWNVLGILDLVKAVTTGTLINILASGGAGEITTAPMAELPLLLIPAFLVPLFIMLHLTALFQARRLALVERARSALEPASFPTEAKHPVGV